MIAKGFRGLSGLGLLVTYGDIQSKMFPRAANEVDIAQLKIL